jgi:hypothetical protein
VPHVGGRLFEAALGTLDLAALHVGERLGLYAALTGGPLTPPELAAATGTAPRYAREWLEEQAVTGILTVDEPDADENERRYSLPDGHREVLLHPESLAFMAPVARAMVGTAAWPAVATGRRQPAIAPDRVPRSRRCRSSPDLPERPAGGRAVAEAASARHHACPPERFSYVGSGPT